MNILLMPEMVTKELMDTDKDKFNELVVDWNEWFRKFILELNMAGNAPERPIS